MDVLLLSVPDDKCCLDVLAGLGERTKNAWIFLERSFLQKLKSTASEESCVDNLFNLKFDATDDYPETLITLKHFTDDWLLFDTISADDIAFTTMPSRPDLLILLIK